MIKNKKVEIKTRIVNGKIDVVVTDGKTEFYRDEKNEQTIAIANSIYFAAKYEDKKEG